MLTRIQSLLASGKSFAFETTLSTRSYVTLVHQAKSLGYQVTLLYFWLSSKELAIRRVERRVLEGGHNIPVEVIKRRYDNGLSNFFKLYKGIVNDWMFIDNSGSPYKVIAEGSFKSESILEKTIWDSIKLEYGK